MKMTMWTILMYLLCTACSKSDSGTTPTVTEPDHPDQYGTPFTAVPDPADAVIYQVNLRAFSQAGNFEGVEKRLDSIQALGVNVLYLMPVYPVGTVNSVNSPYCVKDYTGVNTEFGTLQDLRDLVSAAHERGMAVMLDWVANHTAWDNAWVTDHKDWYTQDASGNIISPANTGWNDVADLNYDNLNMRQAMIKAMQYWVYTANVDGYRCDAADYVPMGFWKQAIDSLKNITSHKLLLLAEGTRKDHFTAGFQLMYGMGFYYNMVDKVYAHDWSAQSIDSVNAVEYSTATASSQVVRYISNHDVDNSDGTPITLLGGKDGSLAAFVVAAYMKGVPMIYDGQEVGCNVQLTFFNNSTPIDWTPVPALTETYKAILAYRNTHDALRTGTLVSYTTPDVCAFTKEEAGDKILVIVNLRNTVSSFDVPAAVEGSNWVEAFGGSSVALTSSLSLQPYQYRVFEVK